MKLKIKTLRETIGSVLAETSQHYAVVRLTDGSEAGHGSLEHVHDMEKALLHLEAIKNQYKFGTAIRSVYAAAVRQLKQDLRKAQLKVGTLAEKEIPGKSRKPRVGFGGGSATPPAHGRY